MGDWSMFNSTDKIKLIRSQIEAPDEAGGADIDMDASFIVKITLYSGINFQKRPFMENIFMKLVLVYLIESLSVGSLNFFIFAMANFYAPTCAV